jgi:uncharacterized protein YbjT (DUF2867 family)
VKVLVTGATGYIGGRLTSRLAEAGCDVRVGVRDPQRIQGRSWSDHVDAVALDITKRETLKGALDGVQVAYYLIHSMQATKEFALRDRNGATWFAGAAKEAGVEHVVYLSGLQPQVPPGTQVSQHLESRKEVGRILAEHVPTTEFRAGPIIGSGSASFEMVRYLADRLPVMVAPRWITTEVTPIAIRDVLSYLEAARKRPAAGIIDIGADTLTFRAMLRIYAKERGLPRRLIVSVPVLTPRLAGLWVQLVTPIPNRIAVPIIKGIVHPLRADTQQAHELYPEIDPMPYQEAVRHALDATKRRVVQTRWADALHDPQDAHLVTHKEGMIQETQSLWTPLQPEEVYARVTALGGENGWPYHWAWRLRGAIDRTLGGPGLRRGRRDPAELRVGDPLDFWRVEATEPPRRLLLRSQMRTPGRAWMQWETKRQDNGTRFVQTAYFQPNGFSGLLYWYSLYPMHKLIFKALARRLTIPPGDRRPRKGPSDTQRT